MTGRSQRRTDLVLGLVGLVVGTLAASAYAAWRAVTSLSGEGWSSFADAMLFPGSLIVVAVMAMVWLGWKANIDG